MNKFTASTMLTLVLGCAPAAVAEPLDPFAEAVRFEHGEGVARDPARALDLYCRAADGGHAGAAFAIAWIHLNGRGVAKDEAKARVWLSTAARRGLPQAARLMERLGWSPDGEEARCSPAPVAPPPAAVAAADSQVARLVDEMAPAHGLDTRLVLAVIQTESGFRPDAVSPKGALGLMQLMPATAARFGVRDPFDPRDNLAGGMRYLRWLLTLFKGDVSLALAAYNAGEGEVLRHGGIPPFAETRDYVARVKRLLSP